MKIRVLTNSKRDFFGLYIDDRLVAQGKTLTIGDLVRTAIPDADYDFTVHYCPDLDCWGHECPELWPG